MSFWKCQCGLSNSDKFDSCGQCQGLRTWVETKRDASHSAISPQDIQAAKERLAEEYRSRTGWDMAEGRAVYGAYSDGIDFGIAIGTLLGQSEVWFAIHGPESKPGKEAQEKARKMMEGEE